MNGSGSPAQSAHAMRVAGDDDGGTAGQDAADGLDRLAAHDDMMTQGECLKPLEVGGQVPEQFVVRADDPIAGYGHDKGYHVP